MAMVLAAACLVAGLLSGRPSAQDSPPPIADKAPESVETKETIPERWADLYALVERTKEKNLSPGAVALYDLWSTPQLPSRIIIVRYSNYKSLADGLLDAVLVENWRKSGDYWILDKDEAVRNIAKAMKIKDKARTAAMRKSIEKEMGPSVILVYRCHREAEPEEEEPPTVP